MNAEHAERPGTDSAANVITLHAGSELPCQVVARCRELGGALVDAGEVAERVLSRMETDDAADSERPCQEALRRLCLDVVSECLLQQLSGRPSDSAVLNQLVELWMGSVLRWCRCLCADGRLGPEDMAHEILVKVLEGATRIESRERFRQWLYGVTWRTVRAEARRIWVRRLLVWEKVETLPVGGNEQIGGESHETTRVVREILARMPVESRTLLWLKHIEGLTRCEIADSLEMAEGTLNRKLHRARQAFEKEARRHGLAPIRSINAGRAEERGQDEYVEVSPDTHGVRSGAGARSRC